MLDEIKSELHRLSADGTAVTLDCQFAPEAGELVKVVIDHAYWHLPPDHLLTLLKELPSGGGSESVRVAIEQKATFVWHGPAPKDSRDTSP